MCMIIMVGVAQCSIVRSASMCSKTCQNHYLWSLNCTALLYWVDLLQQSADFMFFLARSARRAERIQVRKCCDILIVPALVLFSPSNCTRMLAYSEINSTHGKNSRKYAYLHSYVHLEQNEIHIKISCSGLGAW